MHAIVVVADSLCLNMMGCYGNEWVETKHLDQLADDGFLFDQCFPDSPCTGSWLRHGLAGIVDNGWPWAGPLHSALADVLHQQQVATALFSDNPAIPWTAGELSPFRTVERWAFVTSDRSIDDLGREGIDWLSRQGSRPSLLWLDVGMASSPWQPPEELLERYLEEDEVFDPEIPANGRVGETIDQESLGPLRAWTAARTHYFDQWIGDLIERIRSLGIWEDSLFLLTADQGYPLGEHGNVGLDDPWLFEERDHVPLLVRGPQCRRNARSPALVQSRDLLATLAEYFAVDASLDSPTSLSLFPVMRGQQHKQREVATYGVHDVEYAIRTHQWKLRLPVGCVGDQRPTPRELYVKPDDRWDISDVVDQYPRIADALELQLRRWVDAVARGTLDLLPVLPRTLLSETDAAG
ncbi:MAG: sulfatase-like hydrolase/transferase [Planctomycetota bacterium]